MQHVALSSGELDFVTPYWHSSICVLLFETLKQERNSSLVSHHQ